MRLRSEADVQEFLDAVSQCGGDVYLKSPEGDIFNLKSSMSRYISSTVRPCLSSVKQSASK